MDEFLPNFKDCYLLNSKKFKIEIQTIQTFLSLIEHVSFTTFNYLKMLFALIIKNIIQSLNKQFKYLFDDTHLPMK